MNNQRKPRRTFSPAFKKEKVLLIEQGDLSVMELSLIYEVSRSAIYKWLRKYSKLAKTEQVVVEKKSEHKKNIELIKRIRELEQAVGRKQLELDYYKSFVEIINEQQGVDIEKKYKPNS